MGDEVKVRLKVIGFACEGGRGLVVLVAVCEGWISMWERVRVIGLGYGGVVGLD